MNRYLHVAIAGAILVIAIDRFVKALGNL